MKWLRDHLVHIVTAAIIGALATWLTGLLTPLLPTPERVWIAFESVWESPPTGEDSEAVADSDANKEPASHEDVVAAMIAKGCDVELAANSLSKVNKQEFIDLPDAVAKRKVMDDALAEAGCTQRDFREMVKAIDAKKSPVLAYIYGVSYAYGESFLIRDSELGFHLIKTAAEQGNASAQDTLSDLYLNGIGTPRDKSAALAWCWLYNAAEFHRVFDAKGYLVSRKRDCREFVGRVTREERREASRLFDELYMTNRSTSADPL